MDMNGYFQVLPDYFWQWEEGGEVIAIPGGNTLVFREQLAEMMDRLADSGPLPKFDVLVLALAATHPESTRNLNQVEHWLEGRTEAQCREQFRKGFALLRRLTEAPAAFKTGSGRIMLLRALFEVNHRGLSVKKARQFAQVLKRREAFSLPPMVNLLEMNTRLYETSQALSLLTNRFARLQDVLDRITDLPAIEEDIHLLPETPAQPESREFVEELMDSHATFHVGALIRRIWGGLNIPMHSVLPGDQPLGGVSDLSNKGDFSRLLLSEFAHDDLMLLTRLANQEALYLNREVPPSARHAGRTLLIDVSLKNWGTPKTIAHALMLAIARHPKTDIPCRAFAIARHCFSLKFNTFEGIVDGLEVLEGYLDAAEGLEAFLTSYPPAAEEEIFLLSSHEALLQPAMQQALSRHQDRIAWIIEAGRTGEVQVWRRHNRSRKHMQQFVLPLKDLWKKPIARPQSAPAMASHPLRETLFDHCPLLFPGPRDVVEVLTDPKTGEVFLVTPERSLLQYLEPGEKGEKGYRLFASDLPSRDNVSAIGYNALGERMLLMFHKEKKVVFLMNLHTRVQAEIPFPQWVSSFYHKFIFWQSGFHYLSGSHSWYIDPAGGQPVTVSEKWVEELKRVYQTQQKALSALNMATFYHDHALLKNIDRVFIGNTGTLIINSFEVRTIGNAGDGLLLAKAPDVNPLHHAVRHAQVPGAFVFADGSTVRIHPSGMLALIPALSAAKTVYFPSVLNRTIPAATATHFTGSQVFSDPLQHQTALPVSSFWSMFIQPFLNDIQAHASHASTGS